MFWMPHILLTAVHINLQPDDPHSSKDKGACIISYGEKLTTDENKFSTYQQPLM